MKRAAVVAVALLLGLLVAASPAAAVVEASSSDQKDAVVLNGGVRVPAGERLNSATSINGPIDVAGEVTGDVFSVNGDVFVNGRVGGDVTALNGRVNVLPGGNVAGDASSRYAPTVAPGGTVAGSRSTLDVQTPAHVASLIGATLLWIAVSISTLVLGLLLIWAAPRLLDSAMVAARSALGPSIGWGLAAVIGLPIVAVLMLATIVGAPLGLGILFALGLFYSVGYVLGAWLLGRRIVPERTTSRVLAFLAGWAILRLLAIVPVIGSLAWLVAPIMGLGALIVAAWRARQGTSPSSASTVSQTQRPAPAPRPGPAPA